MPICRIPARATSRIAAKPKLKNNLSLIVACRALDAKAVFGNVEVKRAYHSLTYLQIKTISAKEYAKFNKDFRQAAVRALRKITEGVEISPINLNNGEIIFNGKTEFATKHICLRPIQYTVAHHFCTNLKKGKITEAEFHLFRNCRTILNKISWLKEKRILDQDCKKKFRQLTLKVCNGTI